MTKIAWHPHEWDSIEGIGPRWDDLRFPASAINPQGQVSDPDVDLLTGTLLFDDILPERVFVVAQMPHCWLEGSPINPHVHWARTTSAPGDVTWSLRYKVLGVGNVISDYSAADNVTETAFPDDNIADVHHITPFSSIDMTGEKLSTMLIFEVTRLADHASDTYGDDARLLEFDVHYIVDSRGSRQTYIK